MDDRKGLVSATIFEEEAGIYKTPCKVYFTPESLIAMEEFRDEFSEKHAILYIGGLGNKIKVDETAKEIITFIKSLSE